MAEHSEQKSNNFESTEPQLQIELQSAPQPSSPSSVEQQQQESHVQKAAVVALRTRLGHLWQQPRARWLGLLAIVIAFGLSGFLLYLKYFRDEVFPEYYIAAPILVLILLGFLAMGYTHRWSRWTGFNGYNKVSTATEGTSPPQKITITQEYQPGKTFWDWMQLLIIPAVLTALVIWFNLEQSHISDANSAKQHMFDQQAVLDQQQDTMLQTYLDKMSDLLTVNHLKDPKLGIDARSVARSRTLTVLLGLNNPVPGFKNQERKGMLLRFLYEAGLINRNDVLISLNIADLSYAQLKGTNLQDVDLSGANLSGANLSGADLSGANLINANLSKAVLRNAVLSQANLSKDNLTYADLRGAQLDSAHLEYAILSRAELSLADLYRSILTATDLSSADLSSANLGFTNLDYSILKQANLSYADLNNSQLIHADFSGANLVHVDFNHANLTYAKLNRADLDSADISQAMITQEQIAQAASSKDLITH